MSAFFFVFTVKCIDIGHILSGQQVGWTGVFVVGIHQRLWVPGVLQPEGVAKLMCSDEEEIEA